jgi:pyruvate dehydrogenase E2 component (dihydrolipoamide acetyltransferase)
VAEFKVPELGENVAGGDVTRVMVNVGDTITKEQPVLELETDKATIEVPSSVAGRVTAVKVKQGDKIQVGAVVLEVEEGEGEAQDKPQTPTPNSQGATSPAKGAAPADAAPEPEGGKAPEPKGAAKAKDAKPPDQKVVSMPARQGAESASTPKATPKSESPKPKPPGHVAAPAAPGVRRLAREIGVDIDEVQGSGPEGRISEDDVKEHARRILSSVSTSMGGTAAAGGAVAASGRRSPALPDFSRWGEIDRQPMNNIRRTTSERLGHAWDVVAHVTQFDKADITAMEALRRKYREQVAQAGGNLTVTAMLVKVIATAVRQFPQFNASLDPQANEIIYKKYVHVGVAADTDRGLLVPVVRDADRKNITDIAIEVHQLAEKARNKKLSLEEMSGGSITISNLGGIGGTYFTPIVNWPEVAILGVSRGIIEPVWLDGAFQPRQLLPLSLSYDHRVIDGADAMRFLRWVVEAIEQPFLLSLLS